MAAPAPSLSEIAKEGPVLNLLNNHLRELREKLNRISQIEESRAQGKTLNKEQEETLRSKPYAVARIDELEKIRQPLLSAVDQEMKLVLAKCGSSRDIATEIDAAAEPEGKEQGGDDSAVSDLLNLLYFVRVFDLETLMRADDNVARRTKERNLWLTYDSVMEDDSGGVPLKEFDLNLVARIGGMLISRPVNSSLSHKESLEKCAEHAKLWLANADQPIEAASTITYAGLRKMINRIMASPYFTTTPAAAAGNGMNPNPNPINLDLYQAYLLWCQQNGISALTYPGFPPYHGGPPYPGGHPYPGFLPYPDNANVGTGRPLTSQASQKTAMLASMGGASGSQEVQSAAPSAEPSPGLTFLERMQLRMIILEVLKEWRAADDPLHKEMLESLINSMSHDLGIPPLTGVPLGKPLGTPMPSGLTKGTPKSETGGRM